MDGQEQLTKKILKYKKEDFPKSSLILGGDSFCRLDVVKDIQNHLQLEVINITDKISLEFIEEATLRATESIYLIDTEEITDKDQNVILKFLEEPPAHAYIVLLAESKANLLSTIVNRCVTFEIYHYTKDYLKQFVKDSKCADLLIEVFPTPYQLKDINFISKSEDCIINTYNLCLKIIDSMHRANYSNALSIRDKIDFEEDKDFNKCTVKMFFDILVYALLKSYEKTFDTTTYEMYNIVVNQKKKLRDKRINKQNLIDNLLTQLWEVSHVR